MFDCGEGTQIQLMSSNLKAGKISKVFITHLHGDHLYGLPGLICTLSQTNQRGEPIEIYGPLGIAKYLRVSLGLSQSELGFQFRIIEMIPTEEMYTINGPMGLANMDHSDEKQLHPCELQGRQVEPTISNGVPKWTLIDSGAIKVLAGSLRHRVPSFGFIMTEQDLPAPLNVTKLASFGLQPGPIVKKILSGEEVTTPDGVIVTAKDVLHPKQRGRKLVICGDSSDSSKLSPLAEGADVYVHESTLQNDMQETAIERGHCTPAMAAQFALQAGAKLLYLTHFSQRYTESSKKPKQLDVSISDLQNEAKEVFGDNVAVAEDFQTFEIKVPKIHD